MDVSSLRRWLRRTPQPRKLRVDGRKVDVASGVNCWAVTEATVLAMSPTRIEALDSTGTVLRAISLDREDAGDDDAPAPARVDPNETELVRLARIINDAHDNGAKRHADAYRLAFEENTKLVRILAERLGGLEEAWQEAMGAAAQARADAVIAQAGNEDGDLAGQAVAQMLGNAGAAMLTNGQKNGAKKPPPPKAKE
jgi:hypothetical protein